MFNARAARAVVRRAQSTVSTRGVNRPVATPLVDKSFVYPPKQPRRQITLLSVRGGSGERGAAVFDQKTTQTSLGTSSQTSMVSSSLLRGQERVSCFTTDATTTTDPASSNNGGTDDIQQEELPRVLNRYPVSGCAAIGWRPYMEDEALIQTDLVAVFDGHGGASVSRYVRQNLYGHIQAILPRVVFENRQQRQETKDDTRLAESATTTTTTTTNNAKTTPQDYETTLRRALEKINKEVMRIVHWSYQGSTAVVCWLHEGPANFSTRSNNNNNSNCDDDMDVTKENMMVRTLVCANIGDSRLVLSRNGEAIALSRDHKPDDPIEMAYVKKMGGSVSYPSGVPRVNGVMALSRAIGDRSETPCIRAEPDLILETLSPQDEFYVLATDGLWDVMTNQDVVTFLRECSAGDASKQTDQMRQELTKQLVLEALERGAEDNITVVVVWLR